MSTRSANAERFRTRLRWEDLDPDYLHQLIGLAKIEDLAGAGLARRPDRLGDLTAALVPEAARGDAALVAREPLTVCGLPLLPLVLESYSEATAFTPAVEDGTRVAAGARLGTVTGPASALLQAERIVLNFLQHLSGIASETAAYCAALKDGSTALLDTRKTLPGFRVLQKYAFACGGGFNHRMGLFDRIMLKDNHLAVAGAEGGERLAEAVRRAKTGCPELAVEVEVDAPGQIEPVVAAGADIVLFDNFSAADLSRAVTQVGGRCCTEASGGITRERLPELDGLGLDFISTGAPVHQSRWKDIGMDWCASDLQL